MVVSKQHKLAHIVRNTTSLLSSADGKEEAKLPTSLIKTEIKVNRFRAHDSLKIVCKVREELTKGSGMNTCGMCFDDVHVSKIGAMCGNCPNRFCCDCARSWYGQATVGGMIAHAHTLCPCCKSPPKFNVAKQASKVLARVANRTKYYWDPRQYHALCCRCMRATPVIQRVCAQEAPQVENWVCGECRAAEEEKKRAQYRIVPDDIDEKEYTNKRKCPSCGVRTELESGCNHITCSVCQAHWCYYCGKLCESGQDTYSHMDKEGHW
mmetsp:Transcript_6209/g.11483  ORF Transcript_6209/g.11483 Transcript_6209/m.11483 type:complete len:266 (-) Transcript_6209:542-1339(-)